MEHSFHPEKLDKSVQRKDQILQALAAMLEHPQRIKITIKALATQSGVSESSIYRCFASKPQMFEALIIFIEKTLFVLINNILNEEHCGKKKIEKLLLLLLGFSQKNRGITRILICDALINENEYLQSRLNKLHNRLEATLKQALRFAISEQKINVNFDVSAQANLFMCFVIGRWYQFVKSEFQDDPLRNWQAQRLVLLPLEFH
ncbi:MAG: nucleoid occlusion factor SlmA [Nitrosomonas sp.]|nr:MAG: nucleoid occlusion factor SlmA [Nitrosomonas sp.]